MTVDYVSETNRLRFLEDRDGVAAAKVWAIRTAGIYRKAVLDRDRSVDDEGRRISHKGHYASHMPWKRTFIESYLELKRYGLK